MSFLSDEARRARDRRAKKDKTASRNHIYSVTATIKQDSRIVLFGGLHYSLAGPRARFVAPGYDVPTYLSNANRAGADQ